MIENDFFVTLRADVFELFKNSLPPTVVYHNFNHTMNVVEASNEIALAENVSESDLEILLMAAFLHDTGFTVTHKDHEEHSKEIASDYLSKNDIASDKIEKVLGIINATKMPQKPKSHLEEIICDADLDYLGSLDYRSKSNLLRSEWEQNCNQIKQFF